MRAKNRKQPPGFGFPSSLYAASQHCETSDALNYSLKIIRKFHRPGLRHRDVPLLQARGQGPHGTEMTVPSTKTRRAVS